MFTISDKVVEIAHGFEGQTEIKGNLGFKDPTFWKLMRAVGFQLEHPWCAYYGELVWTAAYQSIGAHDVVKKLSKLFSASAVQTLKNFEKAGYVVNKTPKIGSLVIWQTYKNGVSWWTGHLGIIIDIAGTYFKTSEGNTSKSAYDRDGGSVWEKEYFNYLQMFEVKNGLRLVGFVHLKDFITEDGIKKTKAYEY